MRHEKKRAIVAYPPSSPHSIFPPFIVDAGALGIDRLIRAIAAALVITKGPIFVINSCKISARGERNEAELRVYGRMFDQLRASGFLEKFESQVKFYEYEYIQELTDTSSQVTLANSRTCTDIITEASKSYGFSTEAGLSYHEDSISRSAHIEDHTPVESWSDMVEKREKTDFERGIYEAIRPYFEELQVTSREIRKDVRQTQSNFVNLSRDISQLNLSVTFNNELIQAVEREFLNFKTDVHADNELLRQEMADDNKKLREEMSKGNDALRHEIREGNEKTNQILQDIAELLRNQMRPS
ncbi:hypothetical protein FJU08_00660 [Martelella alba]|uniref:Uncharacterized protein n=1 Tax=Martelella alba TaxID=2590451 RepID=A0A506UIE8_9HYPH|nr:hypothetical protein [Martelella alba]TPW33114.1 hypothetical protein FJU08_00660 [Martelella alba]